MPKDYIKLDRTKAKGAELLNAISVCKQLRSDVEHLRDTMLHNAEHPDYADIATVFGCAAGDCEALYNLVNSLAVQLSASDVDTLIDRVG